MPFLGSLTSNLTSMRGDYSGRPFLLYTPEEIIFQTQVSVGTTGTTNYAEITWSGVLSGGYADVLVGMTVLIHTTQTDLRNYKYKGVIRKAATSTKIYINETSQDIDANDYITVLNDYDIDIRLSRFSNDVLYMDYDVTYQGLLPRISDLQSVYATHTTGASASFSFAPTVTAMTSGATISSYLWSVDDGTITTGSTTTKDITVSFPSGAWRWVHLRATDSGSRTFTFHFQVFVGDFYSETFFCYDFEKISYSADWDRGYTGSVSIHGSTTSILDNSRVALVYLDDYAGTTTSINTNIALVGRLRSEQNTFEEQTYEQTTSFTIEGFAATLANLAAPTLAMTYVASTATQWNDITDLHVWYAMWHVLTRFSTYATVSAIDLPTDSRYKTGYINVEANSMLDAINRIGSRVFARMTFAPSGESRVRSDAHYLSLIDKFNLTTIADITTRDMVSFDISRDLSTNIAYIEGGGSLYSLSRGDYLFAISKSPATMNTAGQEIQRIDGLILRTDNTQGQEDLRRWVGTHLDVLNPRDEIKAEMFPSWREMMPSNNDWYTFTIASTDNLRGITYVTTDRWLLRSVQFSADTRNGTVTVNGTWEKEAIERGTGRDFSIIPNVVSTPYPVVPNVSPYGGTYQPEGSGLNYMPSDSPSGNEIPPINPEAYNTGQDPESFYPQNSPSCGTYQVPLRGGAVGTRFTPTNGATYTVNIIGYGDIGGGVVCGVTETLIPSSGNLAVSPLDSRLQLGGSTTVVNVPPNMIVINDVDAGRDLYYFTFDDGDTHCFSKISFNSRKSAGGSDNNVIVRYLVDNVEIYSAVMSGTAGTVTAQTIDFPTNTVGRVLRIEQDPDYTGTKGIAFNDIIIHVNDDTGANGNGDAFYYNFQDAGTASAYPSGEGFLIDSTAPTAPEYNPSHSYDVTYTGTGSQAVFSFNEADLTDNAYVNLVVKICGSGAY